MEYGAADTDMNRTSISPPSCFSERRKCASRRRKEWMPVSADDSAAEAARHGGRPSRKGPSRMLIARPFSPQIIPTSHDLGQRIRLYGYFHALNDSLSHRC